MDTTFLASKSPSLIILTRRSLPSTRHNQIFLPQHHGSLRFFNPINCTSSSNTNDDDANSVQAPSTTPPPGAVEVRFRRRSSRRQSRQQRENNGAVSSSVQSTKVKVSPKKWEDMTLTEKAIELYVGEKGALYWLNKFAYASIYIIIGAWIMFRFVGPALNLYQLDAPPLSPADVLKGSS